MNPLSVLALVKSMGRSPGRIRIVGCEPSPISEQEDSGLSKPVAAMLDKAAELVESLITKNLDREVRDNARVQTMVRP
jgi:hydrogenase maturation protease